MINLLWDISHITISKRTNLILKTNNTVSTNLIKKEMKHIYSACDSLIDAEHAS